MSHSFAVLIAAAGKSRRFAEGTPSGTAADALRKPFVELYGRPVWQHSATLFAAHPCVRQLIVILSPEDRDFFESTYSPQIAQWSLELVDGGAERFESIENGLRQVRREIDFVAIHDAARPCVRPEQIDAVFRAAEQYEAAILATPLVGTIKRTIPRVVSAAQSDNAAIFDIAETVPRDHLWEAQTPQVFRRSLILDAFARRGDACVTDDSQLVEHIGHTVKIVSSDLTNLKITTASDLSLARRLLAKE